MLNKLVVLLLIGHSLLAQKNVGVKNVIVQAEFPGGVRELYHFIGKEMRCPEQVRKANITGKIVVKFTVNTNGSISNVKMMQGIGFGVDEELAKVIKAMPKWSPARKNGKRVKSTFTLPISDLCINME